jgi:hypothetical protein
MTGQLPKFVAMLLAATLAASAALAGAPPPPMKYPEYQSTANCRICHARIVEQHESSMHARSFTDPVFQAQYFRQTLPAAEADPSLADEANRCVACHSPVTFLKNKGRGAPIREFDPSLAGVICDFCHRLGAFKGERPGGGNFMSSPGDKKFGPYKYATSEWHHVYHELQTRSEFCGVCHDDVNRHGLAIKTTYTEWKASAYATEGIQCQDCHMSPQGYLTDERPVFDSGKAAGMTVGRAEDRSNLHTHRFPGTHAATQMEGAISLRIGFERPGAAPGDEVAVGVEVGNSKAGHAIPTGSADLRLVWLELAAALDGRLQRLPAKPARAGSGHDVAGFGPADEAGAGGDPPSGSRLYRAVYLNAGGTQTLDSSTATSIGFDNRLQPRELRREAYLFRIPDDATGPVVFLARIYYLPYPAAFARALGLPNAEPVLMAEARAALPLDLPAPLR